MRALLEQLPRVKRQPNLVFAAARWHGARPGPYAELRRVVLGEWETVRATVLARSTQTNEVGRCATLLPALDPRDGPGRVVLDSEVDGQAPSGATVVVQHSAVIAYLEAADRRRFDAMMRGPVADGVRWLPNEAPGVLPSVTGDLAVPDGSFVLGLDGRPVAITHPHGRALTWL